MPSQWDQTTKWGGYLSICTFPIVTGSRVQFENGTGRISLSQQPNLNWSKLIVNGTVIRTTSITSTRISTISAPLDHAKWPDRSSSVTQVGHCGFGGAGHFECRPLDVFSTSETGRWHDSALLWSLGWLRGQEYIVLKWSPKKNAPLEEL